MSFSRRELAVGSVAWFASLLTGCRSSAVSPTSSGSLSPADPFQDGRLLGSVAFVAEGRAPLDTALGAGLDGRLYTDLSGLTAEKLITPNETFYIRTRRPQALPPSEGWKIRLHGRVSQPVTITAAELDAAARPMGAHLMECAGNASGGGFGMLGVAEWGGVPLVEIMERVAAQDTAARIEISGFDRHAQPSRQSVPGASWIFTPEQLREAGAFLATRMNGAPLPPDHGAPVRLIVPGWYGCVSAKWVDALRWVGDDEPSTAQMREFAVRTHQQGVPQLARDFAPARIEPAAMPVRVEKWQVAGKLLYRVCGIAWGGRGDFPLEIRFTPDGTYEPVASASPPHPSGLRFWTHPFRPSVAADHAIQLRSSDPALSSRRLERGYYVRFARIEEI